MKIESLKIADLKVAPYNPRKISAENLARLETSIREFDLVEPIIVNVQTGNTVIGGHQRLKVLQKMGAKETDCVIVDLPKDREAALNIALNNPNLQGEWDFTKLADLIQEIDTGNLDVSALTGFDEEELERIANYIPPSDEEETEPIPELPKKAITKLGDLWIIGKNRLLCGDSTKPRDVDRLMDGKVADTLVTSPPYWTEQEYDKKVTMDAIKLFAGSIASSTGNHVHRRIQIQTGHTLSKFIGDDKKHFTVLLEPVWTNAFESAGWYLRHRRSWIKGGPLRHIAPSSDQVDQSCECILVFWRPGFPEGGMERVSENWAQTSYWEIPGAGKREVGDDHPCPFPIEIAARMILLYSVSGGIVLEPFCGAGTTMIAAQKFGRCCYGMEIEPRYCDVIVKRMLNYNDKIKLECSRSEAVDEIKKVWAADRAVAKV